MKIIKKLIVIILIIAIIYMINNIYSRLKENNVTPSLFFGDSNSIIDINTTYNNNNLNINLSVEDNSKKSSTNKNNKYNFYYNQLDNNAKIIYNKLRDNISNLKTDNLKLEFSTQFNTLLNQPNGDKQLKTSFQSAIDAFFYDYPELFYIDLTKMSLYTKSISFANKTTYHVSIIPDNNKNYLSDNFSSISQVNQAIQKVENIRNSFITGVSGDNYNKILQVHDTLVNLIDYDSSYSRSNTHNIYGALVENKVVCEGYAKAFKYILDSLNIPCILVCGTATNSAGVTESHMWNYVQLDGIWYGVDPTWDDPIVVGSFKNNTIQHEYFCKGYLTFNRSHVLSNRISEDGMKFTYPQLNMYDYKK